MEVGWIKRPALKKIDLDKLSPAKQEQVKVHLGQWDRAVLANPMLDVYAHSLEQHTFLASKAFMAAAFAGNQFGKSASACILALANCLPLEYVPKHLLQYRTYLDDQPFHARMCVPTLDKHAIGVTLPQLRAWCPPGALVGGGFEKAWSSKSMTLSFQNGSFIEFRSYDQDIVAHAGAARHAIYFDEPPPRAIFEENLRRVLRYKGANLRFTATPTNGIKSWMWKEIYKKHGQMEPHSVEVVTGSSYLNPHLDRKQLAASVSASTSKAEIEARLHGRFVSLEGRVYDAFSAASVYEGGHIAEDIRPEQLATADGGTIQFNIDPGIRQPAVTLWRCNSLLEQILQFDEIYPRMKVMNIRVLCQMIQDKCDFWGLNRAKVKFVIDPAAKIRDQNTGEKLLSEFARHGIYAKSGNNDIDLGIARHNDLIESHQFAVCKRCHNTIDEYEVYSWDDKDGAADNEEGSRKPKATHNHALDCFVAGTQIKTADGQKNVEDIKVGDFVWTRKGLQPVFSTGRTKIAETRTVLLANGRSITGSCEHPVWVDGEWRSLDTIRYGDIVSVCQTPRLSNTAARLITAIQTRLAARIASTSAAPAPTFTGLSGRTPTGRFQRALTSITSTAIRVITNWRTLPSSRRGNTLACTSLTNADNGRGNTWTESVILPPRELEPLRRGREGQNYRAPSGATVSTLSASVSIATTPTKPAPLEAASAPTNVNRLGDVNLAVTTRGVFALSALAALLRIVTRTPRLAEAHVLENSPAGQNVVYNLTVAGKPEYFANGVLVHNCNRYGTLELPWSKSYGAPKPQTPRSHLPPLPGKNLENELAFL